MHWYSFSCNVTHVFGIRIYRIIMHVLLVNVHGTMTSNSYILVIWRSFWPSYTLYVLDFRFLAPILMTALHLSIIEYSVQERVHISWLEAFLCQQQRLTLDIHVAVLWSVCQQFLEWDIVYTNLAKLIIILRKKDIFK